MPCICDRQGAMCPGPRWSLIRWSSFDLRYVICDLLSALDLFDYRLYDVPSFDSLITNLAYHWYALELSICLTVDVPWTFWYAWSPICLIADVPWTFQYAWLPIHQPSICLMLRYARIYDMWSLICSGPPKILPFKGLQTLKLQLAIYFDPRILFWTSIYRWKACSEHFQMERSNVGFESFYFLENDCKLIFSFSLWTTETTPTIMILYMKLIATIRILLRHALNYNYSWSLLKNLNPWKNLWPKSNQSIIIPIQFNSPNRISDLLGCKTRRCAIVSKKKRGFELDPFPGKYMRLGLNRVAKEWDGCKNLSIAGKVKVVN